MWKRLGGTRRTGRKAPVLQIGALALPAKARSARKIPAGQNICFQFNTLEGCIVICSHLQCCCVVGCHSLEHSKLSCPMLQLAIG